MIHNYSSNSNLKRLAKALARGYSGCMKKTAQIKATIVENGNGLPSNGSLVYDSSDNTVYKVIESNGRIQTNSPGMGNSIEVTLEEAGDPSDYTDEEWEEMGDYGVHIDK